jgi:hypothetical protein
MPGFVRITPDDQENCRNRFHEDDQEDTQSRLRNKTLGIRECKGQIEKRQQDIGRYQAYATQRR